MRPIPETEAGQAQGETRPAQPGRQGEAQPLQADAMEGEQHKKREEKKESEPPDGSDRPALSPEGGKVREEPLAGQTQTEHEPQAHQDHQPHQCPESGLKYSFGVHRRILRAA